ncbi:MAG: hypothetical protein MMC33_001523 [Icmadophila ericetorum]|nr:hypothetical protein [Icmadophila ericetorum]
MRYLLWVLSVGFLYVCAATQDSSFALSKNPEDHHSASSPIKNLSHTLRTPIEPSEAEKALSALNYTAYTGQNCFVTSGCTDGTDAHRAPDQICPTGFTSISTAYVPIQAPGRTLDGICAKGWYRHICCPTEAIPQNFQWKDHVGPDDASCHGGCSQEQYQLNTDTYTDAVGGGQCFTGRRTLCCDSAAELRKCSWTDCQASTPKCPATASLLVSRFDNDDGSLCNPETPQTSGRALCCPSKDTYKNCKWSNSPESNQDRLSNLFFCNPSPCSDTQVQLATAFSPHLSSTFGAAENNGPIDCAEFLLPPGLKSDHALCCDPPSEAYRSSIYKLEKRSPQASINVGFSDTVDNTTATWNGRSTPFSNEKGPSDPDPSSGDDPHGFIVLDGPQGSLSDAFVAHYAVVTPDVASKMKRRSMMITDKTTLDTTFEHKEETIHVYCNYPEESANCRGIFFKGAEETIVQLPTYVGDGVKRV